MEQHLRSEYHAAAAGGRLYAFVNAMHAAGICCKKQRCEENIYQFRFYAKHRKAVEQLAQTYHVQLTLTPRKTLQQFLHQYRFRFGIPLGILFSAAQCRWRPAVFYHESPWGSHSLLSLPGARAGGAYGLILPRIAFIMQVAWCRSLMLRSFKRGAAAPCSLTKTYLLMPGRHANIIFCSQGILSVGACLPLGIYFLIYKGNIKEYPHEGTACPTPAPAHFG